MSRARLRRCGWRPLGGGCLHGAQPIASAGSSLRRGGGSAGYGAGRACPALGSGGAGVPAACPPVQRRCPPARCGDEGALGVSGLGRREGSGRAGLPAVGRAALGGLGPGCVLHGVSPLPLTAVCSAGRRCRSVHSLPCAAFVLFAVGWDGRGS